MERDFTAVGRYLPGFGEGGFESLGLPVDANQHATRQIADVF